MQHIPANMRSNWVVHLREAGDWQQIIQLVVQFDRTENACIQPWAEQRYRAEGSYAGYLADLEIVWQYAEQQQDFMLLLQCALIYGFITTQGNADLGDLAHAKLPFMAWNPLLGIDYLAGLTLVMHLDVFARGLQICQYGSHRQMSGGLEPKMAGFSCYLVRKTCPK